MFVGRISLPKILKKGISPVAKGTREMHQQLLCTPTAHFLPGSTGLQEL
jgi:hypothetical protein